MATLGKESKGGTPKKAPRKADVPTFDTSDPENLVYTDGDIRISVLGGLKRQAGQLEATVKVTVLRDGSRSYRDTLNLYRRGQVSGLVAQASEILLLEPGALDGALAQLTDRLEQYLQQKRETPKAAVLDRELPSARRERAEGHLRGKGLVRQLRERLGHIGISGEGDNLLLLFLAMTSRLLDSPLNVVLHASSGSGKSALMEAVALCMPGDAYLEITSISQKGFYHWNENYLSHKILLIQDWTAVDKEIEYLIREIQSKKKVSRVLTLRDKNNHLHSVLKEVHGPVSIIAATTEGSIYEDNANRSIPLYLKEDREQDQKIVERQLQLAAGHLDMKREQQAQQLLRDAQKLLKPHAIRNPYAVHFQFPETVLSIRRMVPIYLQLIAAITLYHQYQREKVTDNGKEYLLTTPDDIRLANELMVGIMVAKSDLLPQNTRNFAEQVRGWLAREKADTFRQRDIALALRMHPSTVKRHLKALMDFGEVQIAGGDRYKKGYDYRFATEGGHGELKERVEETLHKSLEQAVQLTG